MMRRHATTLIGLFGAVVFVAAGCASTTDGGAPSSTTRPAATSTRATGKPSVTAPPVTFEVTDSPPPAPPPDREHLYRVLSGQLDDYQKVVDDAPPAVLHPRGGSVLGAHLVVANANRGDQLLIPATLQSIDVFLDRFQQVGMSGITLTISNPMLLDRFPRHDEYLRFWTHVADKVHARGMTLAVEENVIFGNTPFTTVKPDFAGMTLDRFSSEQRQQAQRIIDDLHPQYLSVLNEPDTFAHNLGLPALNTVGNTTKVVQDILSGLDRKGTKVGAGTGTWSSQAYVDALLADTSIDFVSMHIYPLTPAVLQNLDHAVDATARAGREFVLDEAWLYKADPNELGAQSNVAAAAEFFRRDAFSFWQPLDERFLAETVRYVQSRGVAYLSPFWSGLFFGYLDHSAQTSDLAYATNAKALARIQYQNVQSATLSETGDSYRRLLAR